MLGKCLYHVSSHTCQRLLKCILPCFSKELRYLAERSNARELITVNRVRSTTNGTVHSDWFFLVNGSLIFPAHISLSHPAHSECLEQAVGMSLQVQQLCYMSYSGQLRTPCFQTVWTIPILLENPESRPICDRDRKNPDFEICSDISKWTYDTYTRTHNRVYLTETDSQNTLKNRTKCKIKSSTCTRRHTKKNKHKNDKRFSENLF